MSYRCPAEFFSYTECISFVCTIHAVISMNLADGKTEEFLRPAVWILLTEAS